MISGSVVLYHTDLKDVEKVISSFAPSPERKLFIVDNGETETGLFKNRENIQYIFHGRNDGYGAGNNIAIEKAIELHSTYHVVLNPDVYFDSSILDEMVQYADAHLDVVYMLPKVVYPDGRLQYLCKLLPDPADLIFRRFLPGRWFEGKNDRYCLKFTGYDQIMNPPCLSGCFMFMRTSTLAQYHLRFDERFFMYCEDFDLMRRLHRVGKTIFYPDVTIVHNHGHASYKNLKMMLVHCASAIKYFNKYGWFVDKERKQMNARFIKEWEAQK